MNVSRPPKQYSEILVQFALEVFVQHWLGRSDGRGGGVREIRLELVEIHADEAERAFFVEHREKNVGAVRGFCFGEKDLPILSGVMQARERLPIELATELRRRDVDRRRERARGHDVHGAREAVLRHDLATG